jgi:hypothetical protein
MNSRRRISISPVPDGSLSRWPLDGNGLTAE